MAAAAVANGGYLMKPLVVRRVEDAEGRVVKEYKPVVVRRLLSTETAEVLTDFLKEVVKSGTGRHAVVAGYTVAGKTGTAQKVDASGHYSMADHVASFVGFTPVSHPALLILASLDSPRGPKNQGGDVAAPLFARIAESTLRQLVVPPDDPGRVLRAVAEPALGVVRAAWRPAPATTPAPDVAVGPGIMPDLRGQPAREAAITAARRGLIVELVGSGRVVAQSLAPGTEIEAGNPCVLTLAREPRRSGGNAP
jgi:membrane peptidoglycan carboxypeptidase